MHPHWSDTGMVVVNTVLGPAGVTGNGLLVALIVRSTPKTMKTYSVVLLVLTITGGFAGLGTFMTHARLSNVDNTTVLQLTGPSELFISDKEENANFCMFWYTLQVCTGIFMQVLLVISVLFRLGIFKFSFEKVEKAFFHVPCYFSGLAMFACFITVFCLSLAPFDKVVETIGSLAPNLLKSNSVYYVLDCNEFPQNVVSSIWLILPWIVVPVVWVGRWSVRQQLDYYHYSDYLKRHHIAIANALVVQSIPSIILMILNLTVDDSCSVCENAMLFPVVLMSLFNPIATVLYILPYKSCVFTRLKIKHSCHITPTTSIMSRNQVNFRF